MRNRQIKFRIWDNPSRQFISETEHAILLDGSGVLTTYGEDYGCVGGFELDEKSADQQYTGSTDSAQSPIYEGDIVLWHTEDHFEGGYSYKKMVVGWNQRCMQFRLFEFPNQVGKAAGETFWAEDVRVIGHVFDYENEECWYHLDQSVKNLVKPLEPTC